MLAIRLFRVGKRNQPSFKIVVTDKRRPPRAGRFVEEVGFWNPLTKDYYPPSTLPSQPTRPKKELILKTERIKYWLSVGAKPSATVHNFLISEKILEGKKIPVHKKPKKEKPLPEVSKEPASAKATVGEKKNEETAPGT